MLKQLAWLGLVAVPVHAAPNEPAMGTPATQTADVVAIVATQPAALPAGTLLVDRDTLIRLMVVNEVTTKTAKAGDRFVLRVDENVVVDGTIVIPIGTKAWGEVISAESSGVVGKSGKLSARLLYVDLPTGKLVIRGDNASAGAGGTAETVMGVIGLGPFGLLTRGNNAKLKAGEIFNGYPATDQLFDKRTAIFREAQPSQMSLTVDASK